VQVQPLQLLMEKRRFASLRARSSSSDRHPVCVRVCVCEYVTVWVNKELSGHPVWAVRYDGHRVKLWWCELCVVGESCGYQALVHPICYLCVLCCNSVLLEEYNVVCLCIFTIFFFSFSFYSNLMTASSSSLC
jgi:hypothetical protein